jgi:hypothetical protein
VQPPSRRCSTSKSSRDVVVDQATGETFPVLKKFCLQHAGVIGWGSGSFIRGGSLFVAQMLGPGASPRTEVVRIDLHSGRKVRSAPMSGTGVLYRGLGALWIPTGFLLAELSPRTLHVVRTYRIGAAVQAAVTLSGLLWLVCNGRLETLDPSTGHLTERSMPWLSAGSTIDTESVYGSTLYVSSSGPKQQQVIVSAYDPSNGTHRDAYQTDGGPYYALIGATARFLWVVPPGGMMHSVWAYSSATLLPATGDFASGGPNGEWVALVADGDLWFQLNGQPLECVSGTTGRIAARLELPGDVASANLASARSPAFLAAGDGVIAITAAPRGAPESTEGGVAIYRLDPRC